MRENKGNEAAERKEDRVLPDIEAQQQSDEDTRDDNVSQSQHGKVTGLQTFLQQVLWKHHCSGAKTGGGDHSRTGGQLGEVYEEQELKLTDTVTHSTYIWLVLQMTWQQSPWRWSQTPGDTQNKDDVQLCSCWVIVGTSGLCQSAETEHLDMTELSSNLLERFRTTTWAGHVIYSPRRRRRWTAPPAGYSRCWRCSGGAAPLRSGQTPARTGYWLSSAVMSQYTRTREHKMTHLSGWDEHIYTNPFVFESFIQMLTRCSLVSAK